MPRYLFTTEDKKVFGPFEAGWDAEAVQREAEQHFGSRGILTRVSEHSEYMDRGVHVYQEGGLLTGK